MVKQMGVPFGMLGYLNKLILPHGIKLRVLSFKVEKLFTSEGMDDDIIVIDATNAKLDENGQELKANVATDANAQAD